MICIKDLGLVSVIEVTWSIGHLLKMQCNKIVRKIVHERLEEHLANLQHPVILSTLSSNASDLNLISGTLKGTHDFIKPQPRSKESDGSVGRHHSIQNLECSSCNTCSCIIWGPCIVFNNNLALSYKYHITISYLMLLHPVLQNTLFRFCQYCRGKKSPQKLLQSQVQIGFYVFLKVKLQLAKSSKVIMQFIFLVIYEKKINISTQPLIDQM